MKTLISYMLTIGAACVAQTPQLGNDASATIKRPTSIVRWEGREYAPSDAAEALLDCVLDNSASAKRRENALSTLSRIGESLRGHRRLDELISLCARAKTQEEKCGILLCLAHSRDPRGLPLLNSALDSNGDAIVQLYAAAGLADWNMRAGVDKLIALLGSDVQLPSGRSVADEAANTLRGCNRRNRWGVPEKAFIDAITDDPTISSADYVGHYQQKWLDWLELNPEKFNDWKLGDPPPPNPQSKTQNP